MRILLGITPKLSAEILGRSVLEVDDALSAALRSLALEATEARMPKQKVMSGLSKLIRVGKK
jgi:hypothetical protein